MPWTNITNAQLAVGAPIRSVDLLALRDNIAAVAAGDSGAPPITAITNLNVIGSVCKAFNATGNRYVAGQTVAGSNLRYISGASGQVQDFILLQGGPNLGDLNTSYVSGSNNVIRNNISGNVGLQMAPNMTALSGTWRWMAHCNPSFSAYDGKSNRTQVGISAMLAVRIS